MDVAKRIIDVLKKHNLGSVYGFVNGSITVNMAERAEILKVWKKAGNLVGNHTFDHKDLGKVSANDFINDIEHNESTLIDYADSIPELKVLRFPYLSEGDTLEKRDAIRAYLKNRNYRIAEVSVDFYDWDWIESFERCKTKKLDDQIIQLHDLYLKFATEQFLYSQRLKKAVLGEGKSFDHILLLHFSQVTSTFLDELLSAYEKQGVKWITLDDALHTKSYEEDPHFVNAEGESYLSQLAEAHKLNIRSIYQPEGETKTLEKMCR